MKTNWILVIFVILIVIIGFMLFLTCWSNDTKSLISQYVGILVTGIGFIVAIYQLKFSTDQYVNELKSKSKNFLELNIDVKNINQFYSLNTQVVNKSGEDKEIDYSFLLITKQDEDILSNFNIITKYLDLKSDISATNDFNCIKNYINNPLFINNSIAIIPLSFYFSENIKIGNENPSYTYSFDNNEAKLKTGIYSVRFYIFPNNGGYHRSTVESLIVY